MHLKITKTRKKEGIGEYAKIVQSYRDGEIVRDKLILNLGPVKSKQDRKKFEEILNSMKGGDNFVKEKEIVIDNSKEYGITYTTNMLLEKYEIDKILKSKLSKNSTRFDVYEVIKALIINRLIKPSSDLSAYDWIKNDYSKKLDVKKHQVYRALDYLIKGKDEIEKEVFEILKEKLKLNTDRIYYDLTSSYLEGNCCTIAFYGYSRDHRKDRKQIVIGFVMCDGILIYHEVFEGNTVDKTTLKEIVESLKKKLGIKKAVFVADRGLITEDNLNALENKEYRYILGVQRRNNKLSEKIIVKKINSRKTQFAKEIHKEIIKKNKTEYVRRYILCLNKETKKERLKTLELIEEKLKKKLNELKSNYDKSQKSKGKKMARDGLMLKASKILGKNKRIFNIMFDNGLKFSLNKENYEYEKKIAGRFLLVTNTNMEANEVMKTYKELQMVENAFDEIKNFLDVRPIRHIKEDRVKAHVFVCVLSFLVECIIERFSRESARKTLQKLKRIQMVNLELGESIKKKLTVRSLIDSKNIFKELKIREPMVVM